MKGVFMPEPIEIIFLGTGSAIPTLQRRHAAILFHRAKDYFLFDCGEAAQLGLQAAKVSPMKISKIFITHWHADHFAGLLPLIETMHLLNREKPLEVYGPEAGRFVDALMELSYWGVGFDLRSVDTSTKEKQKLFGSSEFSIFSVPTKHSVPSVGYVVEENSHWKIDVPTLKKYGISAGPHLKRLKDQGYIKASGATIALEKVAHKIQGRKFAYSGDTFAYEPFFKEVAGADLLVHDGTFVEPFKQRAHASVKEVAAMATRYKIKRLILTHLSHRYADSKESLKIAAAIFKNTAIAQDGMKIVI